MTDHGQRPIGLNLWQVFRMNNGKPFQAVPITQVSAHQVKPGAVQIGDMALWVKRPYDLRCLVSQCPEKRLLPSQRSGAHGHFVLKPGV